MKETYYTVMNRLAKAGALEQEALFALTIIDWEHVVLDERAEQMALALLRADWEQIARIKPEYIAEARQRITAMRDYAIREEAKHAKYWHCEEHVPAWPSKLKDFAEKALTKI